MLTRQVVLDKRGRIAGHEFVPLAGGEAQAALLLQEAVHADTAGARVATSYLRCAPEALVPALLDLLDPETVTLRVDLAASRHAPEKSAAALHAAAGRGLRIAVDEFAFTSAHTGWLAEADSVWLDTGRLPAHTVKPLLQLARRKQGVTTVATGVRTPAAFTAAASLGFDLFQGDWFSSPAPVAAQSLQPALAATLHLVQLVRTEADPGEIEDVLKRDPALSFKLLRFVNASGMGLNCEITSFRHAVMILGMKRLLRWASMLVATAQTRAPALGQSAVVRGRMMELLARGLLEPQEVDNAFVVGVFSMLETMTGMPIDSVLSGIALPDTVMDALLRGSGPLAPFLELALACETGDEAAFARLVDGLSLTARHANLSHLEALAWAEELLRPACS